MNETQVILKSMVQEALQTLEGEYTLDFDAVTRPKMCAVVTMTTEPGDPLEGLSFYVGLNKKDDRAVISPRYPEGVYTDGNHKCQVTVGLDRGGDALAQAIASRFFPKFTELYAERLVESRKVEAASNGKAELANTLALVLSGTINADKDTEFSFDWKNGEGYGQVRMHDDKPVMDLELRGISAPLAQAVCAFLATARQ